MTDLKKMSVEELRPDALCDFDCEGRCRICPVDAWDELALRLEESEKRNKALVEAAKQDAEILKRVELIAESRAACRKDPTINGHGHAQSYEEMLWGEIEFFLLAKSVRAKDDAKTSDAS